MNQTEYAFLSSPVLTLSVCQRVSHNRNGNRNEYRHKIFYPNDIYSHTSHMPMNCFSTIFPDDKRKAHNSDGKCHLFFAFVIE